MAIIIFGALKALQVDYTNNPIGAKKEKLLGVKRHCVCKEETLRIIITLGTLLHLAKRQMLFE